MRNGGRVEKVRADDKPFQADSNSVEARYYDDVGTIRFEGVRMTKASGIRTKKSRCEG